MITVRRSPRAATGTADWHDRFVGMMSRVVMLAAVWSLVSIAVPHRPWRWPGKVDLAFGVLNVPAEPSLFTAAVMFLLAGALRRRLRAAMLVALMFQAAVGVLQLVELMFGAARWTELPTGPLELTHARLAYVGVAGLLGIVIAIAVFSCRTRFTARLRPGAVWRSTLTLIAGLAASSGVTTLLTIAFPDTLRSGADRVWWAVRVALGAITDLDTIGLHGESGYHWTATLAGLMSAVALLAAVLVFVRSARAKQCMDAADELAVRRLLLESGERDSLGYLATRRDKSVVFSPDRRAAVTYRVVASVSLASADPIGRTGSWPAAIEAWLSEARRHGWLPAVLSASEPGAGAYVAAGLKALEIGGEAIIDVDRFSLSGPTMRSVRQAVTRIRRAEYTVRIRRQGEIPSAELAELRRLSEQWRGNNTERGFSMALNRLGDPADGRCVLVTAHDRSGAVRGLLSFVPWGSRGLSLDVMRRDRQAENGLIEFMVAGLVESCPDLGIGRVSLNFAMFRSVFTSADQVGAGPVVRMTHAALSVASQFWQLETLYRSNSKYLPSWAPRFMCWDPSLNLARAAITSGMAEGFLPSPRPVVTRSGADDIALPDGRIVSFADAARDQETQFARPAPAAHRLSDQQRVRRAKIAHLLAAGREAYPVGVPRTCGVSEVRSRHPELPAGQSTGERVSVTGRVRSERDFGGIIFAVLSEAGTSIQVMLAAEHTPPDSRLLWKRTVDLGDQVSVTGEIVASKAGELSILVEEWVMAAKCLNPIPDVHGGLSDPAARVRQRFLDLMVNDDAMAVLRARSTAVSALRDELCARGFTEVETPMLQAVHGGASARPFRTHINAYNTDLYLRIAPELYLKQLCVAGMPKIFELNRCFRNEGADSTHNPEFTSVEVYQAHADYADMRALSRELILGVACRVHGSPIAQQANSDGTIQPVDLSRPWPTVTVHDAVSRACGLELTCATPVRQLREICAQHKIHSRADASAGELVVTLYEALVEKQTRYPTYYIDFPIEACPLTRTHRENPSLAERWDLVAFGTEIGTAYSELTDPIDQRARLTEQSHRAAAGDPAAMQLDDAFLTALEYAMPPTGGLGLGVDRLVMMLTGSNIRSTLTFPFTRAAK